MEKLTHVLIDIVHIAIGLIMVMVACVLILFELTKQLTHSKKYHI